MNQSQQADTSSLGLHKHSAGQAPHFKRITRDRFKQEAGSVLLSPSIPHLLIPVMDLSARQPYDQASGLMDVYMPLRWDATSNLVFMAPIVFGPSPGEWTGSVAYVRFDASATATYLIATYFTGYEATMSMYGPWGTASASTASTSDSGVVLAVWEGTAGSSLFFNVSCSAPIIAYLGGIEVFA